MLILLKAAPDGHGAPEMDRYPAPGEPTPAQAESGNYPKRRVSWNGLSIRIENEAGSVRYGRGWQTRMLYPYGYIERTESTDGDEVDVYLGPALDYAPTVFVVHQMTYGDWEKPDEDKCMLGFMSEDDARAAYLKHYDDPRFLGSITEMPVGEFVRKARATRAKPGLIKAKDSLVLFTKARVGAYLRNGKMVNLAGYDGRQARAQPAPGQGELFSAEEAPPPPAKPNPYKGKDPVLDTPDLFTGMTRREEPAAAAPPPAPAPPPEPPAKPNPLAESRANMERMRSEAAGDSKKAGFYRAVLPDHERAHARLESAFAAFQQHGDGTELSTADGKRHAILLPDASSPGKYRYQMFDERGFSAHSTHNTPEEAVADAASQGFHVHNPGILDKLAGTDEWAHGMAINAIMQAHNSGQLGWAEAMDKIKALSEEREEKRAQPAGDATPAPDAKSVAKEFSARINALPAKGWEAGFEAASAWLGEQMKNGAITMDEWHSMKRQAADHFRGRKEAESLAAPKKEMAVGKTREKVVDGKTLVEVADVYGGKVWVSREDLAGSRRMLPVYNGQGKLLSSLKSFDPSKPSAIIRDNIAPEHLSAAAAPASAPAPAPAPEPAAEDDHPSKPTRSLLNLVPEDRRAEWLDLHKRQHEMHHYDLGQLKEQIAKHRTPMHRALTKLRESEALAKEARKGGDLPGTGERIRLADNAVAQNSIEFQRHSKEVERLKNMHQTVYERVAALGRQKNAIASETGSMDIDWASMKQRAPDDQARHEKTMLAAYRAHYKAKDAEARAAKKAAKAGGTMAKAWDWLGTEQLRGQLTIFLAAAR